MKGTFKLKKSKGKPSKKKVIKPSDNIPKAQPMPIYSGFGNVKNKASRKVQKQGGKLKKRTVRQ
jgi:hypothetical protein